MRAFSFGWCYTNQAMNKTTTFETIFSPITAGRVLDVATGRGSFIHVLSESLQSYDEIIGIDTNADTAEIFAKSFAEKPISYQQMDAYTLDFGDASFDTICIANSLHHLDDPVRVLAEMQRVLKPGGKFIINEMFRDSLSEAQQSHMLLHHWWAAVDSAEGIVHNETYTKQELIELAQNTDVNEWAFHEITYLDDDPKDEATIKQLDQIIDRYIKKAKSLSGSTTLIERGQALRERVHEIGFHGATALLAIGIK